MYVLLFHLITIIINNNYLLKKYITKSTLYKIDLHTTLIKITQYATKTIFTRILHKFHFNTSTYNSYNSVMKD